MSKVKFTVVVVVVLLSYSLVVLMYICTNIFYIYSLLSCCLLYIVFIRFVSFERILL